MTRAGDVSRTVVIAGHVAASRAARKLRRSSGAIAYPPLADWPQPDGSTAAGSTMTPSACDVLHVVSNSLPYTQAGYTIRTQAVLEAQRSVGLRPVAITSPGFPVSKGVLGGTRGIPDATDVNGITYEHILPLRLGGPDSKRWQRAYVEGIAKAIDRHRPTIVHAATPHANGLAAAIAAKSRGIPFAYEVRGFLEQSWLSRNPDGGDSEYYREARERETEVMLAADLITTLGQHMADDMIGRGVPAERIVLTPNGVSREWLDGRLDASQLRADLGIPQDHLIIGQVTTMFPHEGLDDLITAVGILAADGAPITCVLVGDGIARPDLVNQVAAAGLGDRVLLPGRVPFSQSRLWTSLLDIAVFPRKDSAVARVVTPLKPFEAMALGTPVVVSALPALLEGVTAGVTGLATPAGDPQALATTIAGLASPERRASLGEAGRDWVAKNRTWERTAQAYADAYSQLGRTS